MSDESKDWLALKSDWQANAAAESLVSARMRRSLRWRILGSRLWLAVEIVSFLYLGLLVARHLWMHQLAPAVTLASIMGFCIAASVWARRGRGGGMQSLLAMIEFTLVRARTTLRLVYGTYAVIAVLLVATLGGALPPLTGDEQSIARLTWLGFSAVVTVVYHVYTRRRMRRFESVRRSLNNEGRNP